MACLLTFGLVATYMLVPVGFGAIFLNDILGITSIPLVSLMVLTFTNDQIPSAMVIPVIGMLIGLLIAIFLYLP